MIYKKENKFYFILISIIIFILDQIIKYSINENYANFINKNYIFFTIDFVKNYGAAFNIFNGSRVFLSLVSIFFSNVLIYLIMFKKNIRVIDLYGYSLILGGTLGNGLDRVLKGYVIDFINLKFINFPVFNIADISINIGFILIFYSLIKSKE